MAICEDAPCCGCCGPAVWAADAQAEEEYAMERHLGIADDDDYDDWDDGDGDYE